MDKWKLCKDLILLEKEEKLLLANGASFNPLYFPEGKEYILSFINNLKNSNPKNIENNFPDRDKIIDLLSAHHILIKNPQKKDIKPEMPDFNQKRKGASLYLLLSQSCNLSCIYCLDGKGTYKKDKALMMTEKVAFKAVEKTLESIKDSGHLNIIFFGGEPLLNWPLAKKTILKCENDFKRRYNKIRLTYHITSNLFHLPKDLMNWAEKYNITFLCDIDGPEKIHNLLRPQKNKKGSFEKVCKNVKDLSSRGFKVSLRATVTSHNQDYMVETALIHKELGAVSTAFATLNPVNSDEIILPPEWSPEPQKYIDGLKKIMEKDIWKINEIFPLNDYERRIVNRSRMLTGCGAAHGNTPAVSVTGDIYPCIYWVGIPSLKTGNVFDEKPYYSSPVIKKLMKKLHIDYTRDCQNCSWRYFCAGGCPVHKISVLENPLAGEETVKYSNSINCITSKGILEYILWKKADEAYKK